MGNMTLLQRRTQTLFRPFFWSIIALWICQVHSAKRNAIMRSVKTERRLPSKKYHKKKRVVNIENYFQDSEDLEKCLGNILSSDTNNNGMISSDEYAHFIAVQSGGLVDLPFGLLNSEFIAIFFAEACTSCYDKTKDEDCCVGEKAALDLTNPGSEEFTQTLLFVCNLASKAIQDLSASDMPSYAPTMSQNPSKSPIPSHLPSGMPSDIPSDMPSNIPSDMPSDIPSDMPSDIPSDMPSDMPSDVPSEVPSDMPSDIPSDVPSEVPSSLPNYPTQQTSYVPTIVMGTFPPPSSSPTASMSPSTTQVTGTCDMFSYVLTNSANLTAYDILNMVNNTIKLGLEAAGDNVTIQILNQSYPESTINRRLNGYSGIERRRQECAVHTKVALEHGLTTMYGQENTQSLVNRFLISLSQMRSSSKLEYHQNIWQVLDIGRTGRRLAYFTYDHPSEVINVVEDPLCTDPLLQCAIVQQQTCVILEAGDDEGEVRALLRAGLRRSLLDGSFQEAIPPEYIPPDG